MELERSIRSLVVENFLLGREEGLSSSQSLLSTGVVDSTGVLELVSLLEKSFQIKVADQDLVPENLDSIDNIVRFVQGRISARGTA